MNALRYILTPLFPKRLQKPLGLVLALWLAPAVPLAQTAAPQPPAVEPSAGTSGATGTAAGAPQAAAPEAAPTPAAAPATPAEPPRLELEAFLESVRQNNEGLKSALEGAQGAQLRQNEGELIHAISLFAKSSSTDDAQPPTSSFSPERTLTQTRTVGFSHLTYWGMSATLSHAVTETQFVGANPLLYGASDYTYYQAYTSLDISQPLWRNSFGRENRLQKEAAEAARLMDHHNLRYRARQMLSEAEMAYWSLMMSRENVEVAQASVERAKRTRDWNQRRAGLNLTDRSALLQAEAAYQASLLAAQRALSDERAAARRFNALRGRPDEAVAERLAALSPEETDRLKAPERQGTRDDVLAAKALKRMSVANAAAGLEKSKPDLSLFATLKSTGLDTSQATAVSGALDNSHPTKTVGLNFSIPFGPGVDSAIETGYQLEQQAAELNFSRKQFEQEQEWKNLLLQWDESRERLRLSRQVELAQLEKLAYEESRLRLGRTTTNTVIMFEEDYSQARLNRVRTQMEVLNLLATLKTYTDTQP